MWKTKEQYENNIPPNSINKDIEIIKKEPNRNSEVEKYNNWI